MLTLSKGVAQVNFVQNPSFEELDTCSVGGFRIPPVSWDTLRAGGGSFLPGIVTTCCGTHGGGHGGTSRITNGSGVHGRGGC